VVFFCAKTTTCWRKSKFADIWIGNWYDSGRVQRAQSIAGALGCPAKMMVKGANIANKFTIKNVPTSNFWRGRGLFLSFTPQQVCGLYQRY
jgi:hypothetical protein